MSLSSPQPPLGMSLSKVEHVFEDLTSDMGFETSQGCTAGLTLGLFFWLGRL